MPLITGFAGMSVPSLSFWRLENNKDLRGKDGALVVKNYKHKSGSQKDKTCIEIENLWTSW